MRPDRWSDMAGARAVLLTAAPLQLDAGALPGRTGYVSSRHALTGQRYVEGPTDGAEWHLRHLVDGTPCSWCPGGARGGRACYGAARDKRGAARHAAYAAGQAGAVAHVAAHELGATADPIKAARATVSPVEAERRVGWSAGGSVTSSRRGFAIWSSTTSGCGTTSADRSSTADAQRIRARCTR